MEDRPLDRELIAKIDELVAAYEAQRRRAARNMVVVALLVLGLVGLLCVVLMD